MREGIRIGVDVGTVRVGVSRSDPHGMLAVPVETVHRGNGDIRLILAHVTEWNATEIVVGLPLSLSGSDTASTADARAFARRLAAASGITPVRLVDERLSTVSALGAMRAAGRSTKQSRSVIDQVAAVIILQHALDAERSGGTAPGVIVTPEER